jgi:hypothetical protein
MRNGSGNDSIFHGIKPYCGGGQPNSEAIGCLESAEQVLSLSERPERLLESDEREWWVLAAPGIVDWAVGRGRCR